MQFLHNHPHKEKELSMDEGHVIVDMADWLEARKLLNTLKAILPMKVDDIKLITIDDNLWLKDVLSLARMERLVQEINKKLTRRDDSR